MVEQGKDVLKIKIDHLILQGDLKIPPNAQGIIIFAHGSGSSRLSPRNQFVAKVLREGGLATLLIDLLTVEEEELERETAHLRFDIEMLTKRLGQITEWVKKNPSTSILKIGYFGASTGAAAALAASVHHTDSVKAIVSRGGRPDLAEDTLPFVKAPSLLIVGGHDPQVIELNQRAERLLKCEHKLKVVANATHLFEEPGTLEQVASLALDWFLKYLDYSKI